MSSEMRADCQAEMCKDTDVHARLIYSEAYLCSVLDVIFFWRKNIEQSRSANSGKNCRCRSPTENLIRPRCVTRSVGLFA